MGKYNILKHELVPAHELLSKEEEEELLQNLGIKREQLPKIRKSDPVIRVLEEKYGPIEPGRIIKIIRNNSRTSGIYIVYRMVVGE